MELAADSWDFGTSEVAPRFEISSVESISDFSFLLFSINLLLTSLLESVKCRSEILCWLSDNVGELMCQVVRGRTSLEVSRIIS